MCSGMGCRYENYMGDCKAPVSKGRYPDDAQCVIDQLTEEEEQRLEDATCAQEYNNDIAEDR